MALPDVIAAPLVPALGPIPRHLDYYREFNVGGRREAEAQPGAFVIVVLDGQQRATDGGRVEQILPREEARELALCRPLAWSPLPAGARVISER